MTDGMSSGGGGEGAPVNVQQFGDAIERLTASILADGRIFRGRGAALPDRDEVAALVERLRWLAFPGYFGPRHVTVEGMRDHVVSLFTDIVSRLSGQLRA